MVSLRLFVAIFAFVAVAVAIKCYNQTTSDNAQPKRNVKCNSGSKYCIKVKVEQELLFLNMYGCDTGSCHIDAKISILAQQGWGEQAGWGQQSGGGWGGQSGGWGQQSGGWGAGQPSGQQQWANAQGGGRY
ncbi:hypothetical protein KIN20_025002 [Parelaphostrongylus tenuis]|uniref:Uncharacterized protein n=1 Tax=Parelaphostrongylus tenuis TaxID=148309 RepID=A0AAD5QU18_PARTN|nr:hypothetical protein KIN20_025002 [Parelaphostrongylus tenuis]